MSEKLLQYQRPIRSIIIEQLIQSGWRELIRIPVGNLKSKPEDIQEAIEQIRNMLYEGDKMFLSIQGMEICIRGLHQGATFRVGASYDLTIEPFTI